MSVDLADLVPLLQAEVDAPGEDSFTDASEDDWVNQLRGGFWEMVLDGLVSGYTEDEGIVTSTSATTDISRELQQLIIFYAGVKVIRNKLRTMGTKFRAKAGPVEFETENSANVMKSIMDELVRKRNLILARLSDLGSVDSVYVDMVIARSESISYGDTWFTNY